MRNPILFAVPVFLLMMAAELAIARHRGLLLHRAADTLSNLSLDVISQLVGVFTKLATMGLYTRVYSHAVAAWCGWYGCQRLR